MASRKPKSPPWKVALTDKFVATLKARDGKERDRAEINMAASCNSEYSHRTVATRGGDQMRSGLFLTTLIAGVLGVLATQAQAESKTYRTVLVPEKSVQACSGWGQTYTVDVSNGVLTLGVNYARRLFSEPVKSDGKITTSYRDPSGGTLKFIGHGNGEYELIAPLPPCYYRLVPTEGRPPWNS